MSKNTDYEIIILDFIFYTTENVLTAINSCSNFTIDQVELHYWKVNRDQCLANDKIRMEREKRHGCTYTIINHSLEIPKLEYFAIKYKNIKFNICEHEVFKAVEILDKELLYESCGLISIKD